MHDLVQAGVITNICLSPSTPRPRHSSSSPSCRPPPPLSRRPLRPHLAPAASRVSRLRSNSKRPPPLQLVSAVADPPPELHPRGAVSFPPSPELENEALTAGIDLREGETGCMAAWLSAVTTSLSVGATTTTRHDRVAAPSDLFCRRRTPVAAPGATAARDDDVAAMASAMRCGCLQSTHRGSLFLSTHTRRGR